MNISLSQLFYFRYVAEGAEPPSKKSKDLDGGTTTTSTTMGTAINQKTTTENQKTTPPSSLNNQNSTTDQFKSTTSNDRTSDEEQGPGLQKATVKRSKSTEEVGEQKELKKKVENKETPALNSSFEASIKGLEEDLLKIPGRGIIS